MSDIFLKAKANAEREIMGKPLDKATRWLSDHYMDIAVYDKHINCKPSRMLRVQVQVDEFNRITGIEGWF